MDEKERYEFVCRPALDDVKVLLARLADKLDGLISVVQIGNGKPALVQRVTALEERMLEERTRPGLRDMARDPRAWAAAVGIILASLPGFIAALRGGRVDTEATKVAARAAVVQMFAERAYAPHEVTP
jgi:hypothetical protein